MIGYAETIETTPGVWTEVITEHPYYGDVIKNVRRLDKSEYLNDDINISNSISVVGDAYAYNNVFAMRYISWMGARWKISSVDVQRPRLILTIGGVWNGDTP